MRLIDRPWWYRALVCGGTTTAAAIATIGLLIATSDLANDQWFNGRFGWTPLWPTVRFIGVALPIGGVVVGLLIPFYRRKFGGAVVGLACAAVVEIAMLIAYGPFSALSWRLAILGFCVIATAIAYALDARGYVLGERQPERPSQLSNVDW